MWNMFGKELSHGERERHVQIYLYICMCMCAWYECKLSRLITTRVPPSSYPIDCTRFWLHFSFQGQHSNSSRQQGSRGEQGGVGGADRELMYNSCGICLFGHLTASWNSSSVTHSHCFVSYAHFHAFPPFLRSRVTRCVPLRLRMCRCECGCVLQ